MGQRRSIITAVIVSAAVLAVGFAFVRNVAPSKTVTQTQPGLASSACQTDPHAGVHDPGRLTVLSPCATFVGTVSEAPALNPSDGDVTFNATPDPGYASMLNATNVAEGGLHLEIMPRDQPGCTTGQPVTGNVGGLGVCSGAHVLYPPLGAHVRVVGPWVLDTANGWNEIHPVWSVEVIPLAGPPPPEQQRYKGALTGSGGARARVALTVTGEKLCWVFSALRNIDRPLRADVRAAAAAKPTLLLPLGSRYFSKGCVNATSAVLEALAKSSPRYAVAIYTQRHPRGAVRGRLRHIGD
jgi:hypothetical protein